MERVCWERQTRFFIMRCPVKIGIPHGDAKDGNLPWQNVRNVI